MDGRESQLHLPDDYTKCKLHPWLPSCRRESFLLAPRRNAKNKNEKVSEDNLLPQVTLLSWDLFLSKFFCWRNRNTRASGDNSESLFPLQELVYAYNEQTTFYIKHLDSEVCTLITVTASIVILKTPANKQKYFSKWDSDVIAMSISSRKKLQKHLRWSVSLTQYILVSSCVPGQAAANCSTLSVHTIFLFHLWIKGSDKSNIIRTWREPPEIGEFYFAWGKAF